MSHLTTEEKRALRQRAFDGICDVIADLVGPYRRRVDCPRCVLKAIVLGMLNALSVEAAASADGDYEGDAKFFVEVFDHHVRVGCEQWRADDEAAPNAPKVH